MPVLIRGNNTLILQPDQSVSQAADGTGVARLSYKCKWEKINDFLPTPLQPHPVFSDLLLYEFAIQREPGDIGRYDCVFMGVLAADPTLLAQYDVSSATSTEPIETHPRFSYPPGDPPVTATQLATIQQALDTNTQPTGLTGAALMLYEKRRRGIDSFLRVGTVVRKSYCLKPDDTTALFAQYALTGKIVDLNDPNFPSPPVGQNYIATGTSWRKQAGVITVTEESLLSGLGGWDTDLYDYTVTP